MNIFEVCEKHTREEHALTYFLAKLFGRRDCIKYFFLFYSYLRMVDDLIDDNAVEAEDKKKYLNKQDKILNGDFTSKPDSREVKIISALKEFDAKYEGFLTGNIQKMLKIFRFDLERKGAYITKDELFKYYYLESEASLSTILFFIVPAAEIELYDTIELGLLAKVIHTIRDLNEDLKQGIINIPQEYREHVHDYIAWVKKEYPAWVKDGRNGIVKVRNFKFALICIINYNRYLAEFHSKLNPGSGIFIRLFFLGKVMTEIPVVISKMVFY